MNPKNEQPLHERTKILSLKTSLAFTKKSLSQQKTNFHLHKSVNGFLSEGFFCCRFLSMCKWALIFRLFFPISGCCFCACFFVSSVFVSGIFNRNSELQSRKLLHSEKSPVFRATRTIWIFAVVFNWKICYSPFLCRAFQTKTCNRPAFCKHHKIETKSAAASWCHLLSIRQCLIDSFQQFMTAGITRKQNAMIKSAVHAVDRKRLHLTKRIGA